MSELLIKDVTMATTNGSRHEVAIIRPATTREIMDGHPVCRDCKWLETEDYKSYCVAHGIDYGRRDPTTDYCRHWEAKQ